MLVGANLDLPVATAPEAKLARTKGHTGWPSLRLILADAFFFCIACFVVIAWIAAIAITIAIMAAPFIWALISISKFVSFCTP